MYQMLIVDDEPHILEGMKVILDWKKYGVGRIETANCYEDAISKAIEMNPDIAIFDVCIGDARGYDVINKLNSLHLKTAYIMMSGYGEFEYAREALRCGAKDYLLKPVDSKKLENVVKKIIVEDLHGTIDNVSADDNEIDPVLQVRYDTLSNLANKIIMMIKAEYNQNINLKSVAEKFRMNGTYLGQIFLKETHLKFSEYLMVYRLLKAQERIQNTSEKISYIAYSVGYTNLNYFYSHFREYFNMSPSELRNETSQK